jgi:hypothetical protein
MESRIGKSSEAKTEAAYDLIPQGEAANSEVPLFF